MATIAELGLSVDSSQVRRASGDLTAMGVAGNTAGTNAAKGLGLLKTALVGVGFAALAKEAVNMTTDFQASLNNVEAKLRGTAEEMQKLEAQAKTLGATTAFSASEAADAMGFLAQAGLNTTQIYEAMPAALQLAAAGNISLAKSADIATNVMGGMGLQVKDLSKINDILATTSSNANVSIEEMASTFSQSAPIASSLGVSIEEVATLTAIMGDAGIKAERAGTALKNMFLTLQRPVGDAKAAMLEFGITQQDIFDRTPEGRIKHEADG